jgi:two-component system response regulator LytT
MTILIIEDEAKTAKELKRLLEGLDDSVRVLDILQSVKSAIEWFRTHPAPDLVFSDIQLADGLCFDIHRSIPIPAPIVFCTAFDEYAIQAFQANSIDYLLKPIDENKLQLSLEKYKQLKRFFDASPANFGASLTSLGSQLGNTYRRSILVYIRDKIIPVKTLDIAFVHASNGLVNLTTRDDHKYSSQQTMEQLEAVLDPRQFFRANRQFIVNRDSILAVEQYFNRRLYLKTNCATPEMIIVSKIKAADFLEWMQV